MFVSVYSCVCVCLLAGGSHKHLHTAGLAQQASAYSKTEGGRDETISGLWPEESSRRRSSKTKLQFFIVNMATMTQAHSTATGKHTHVEIPTFLAG